MYRNTRLAVVYHVAHMGTWQAVDAEITERLDASGLLEHADCFVRNDCRSVELYEFPSFDLLRGFAAANPSFAILYLHTKGVTKPEPCIDDWRASMLYWMVERWRECLDKLIAGHDVVGPNLVHLPIPHFQGNFWWAKASHLNRLGDVREVAFTKSVDNQGERHKAEFWLLTKQAKIYEPYHHRVRPYSQLNPRSNYVGKKF